MVSSGDARSTPCGSRRARTWAREYRPIYAPFEAALDRFVAMPEPDFIGREGCCGARDAGPRRALDPGGRCRRRRRDRRRADLARRRGDRLGDLGGYGHSVRSRSRLAMSRSSSTTLRRNTRSRSWANSGRRRSPRRLSSTLRARGCGCSLFPRGSIDKSINEGDGFRFRIRSSAVATSFTDTGRRASAAGVDSPDLHCGETRRHVHRRLRLLQLLDVRRSPAPYLDGFFKDYFVRGELPGPAGAFPHGHRAWLHPEGFSRADIKPRTQDEHLSLMREKHLDRYKINCAILTGDEAMEASTLANPYYAAALVRAYNDWMIDWWPPKDHASSTVDRDQAPRIRTPPLRRSAGSDIILGSSRSWRRTAPSGRTATRSTTRSTRPAPRSAFRSRSISAARAGSTRIRSGPGRRPFFWETHALLPQSAMTHMASMIAHGVFEKWPGLYFVVIECGSPGSRACCGGSTPTSRRCARRRPGSRCCRASNSRATSGSRPLEMPATKSSISGPPSKPWMAATR